MGSSRTGGRTSESEMVGGNQDGSCRVSTRQVEQGTSLDTMGECSGGVVKADGHGWGTGHAWSRQSKAWASACIVVVTMHKHSQFRAGSLLLLYPLGARVQRPELLWGVLSTCNWGRSYQSGVSGGCPPPSHACLRQYHPPTPGGL
jgi:hypothetical protein